MENKNNTNKDVGNSLSNYADVVNKGTNLTLDSANQINKWYEEQVNKITETDISSSRLETNVDNSVDETENKQVLNKLETKVDEYKEIQTNNENSNNIKSAKEIKTQLNPAQKLIENSNNSKNTIKVKPNIKIQKIKEILTNSKSITNTSEKIYTVIKGLKTVNNATARSVKLGKSINTGLNSNTLKSFESTSNRLNNKAVKKATNKITSKAKKKVISKTTNLLVKAIKAMAQIMLNVSKLIISMLPSIAPAVFIMIIVLCFCSFFGFGMSSDTLKKYEEYMISTQNDFDNITTAAYNNGTIVEGTIEGKGMINWRASMSIIQMLNGELSYDKAEENILNEFAKANLYEQIKDVSYTYEKEIEETDGEGNKTTKTVTTTETKKVVNNPSLDDYINWCNSNFGVINEYKKMKKIEYDKNQTAFTDSEVEQIRLLYGSTSFFDLFSENFKTTYAYSYVNIDDEQIQAIYNEFLANVGVRYLMDHSNLKYDECMDYYDCSSWVIHVLRTYWNKNNP